MLLDRTSPIPSAWTTGRELGRGSLAVVYAATDGERHGALKLSPFPRSCTPVEAERAWPAMSARLDAVASLGHPALIHLWDWGLNADDGQIWVAMERLWATSLPTLAPTLRPAQWLAIARTLGDAVAHAHTAQVWHGDIKPSNILIAPNATPTLIDFALTGPDPAPGSPRWMAPECLLGGPCSPASDLYALGQCLAEMTTGRPAFALQGSGPSRLLNLQELKSQGGPMEVDPRAPRAMQQAIANATAQEPADRPTALEFAGMLAT
ncbi:MAG: serine/threonine-protein kinase [Myxococcota bacterium]